MNVATEAQAREVANEIIKLLTKHKIWYRVTEKRSPDLKFIEITDISIKVNGPCNPTQATTTN